MNQFLRLVFGILFLLPNTLFSSKCALIFGVTGQDGIYLTEFLLQRGYTVHGITRRCSGENIQYLDGLSRKKEANHLILHFGDVTDPTNVREIISKIRPTEIYNLAAQSHVKLSFEMAFLTAQTNALGTLNILEAIRIIDKTIRFYQAGSSEMFGKSTEFQQNEETTFHPESPYGIAKLYSHWITNNYRNAYGIFACNGILFNHESPLRNEMFVTRKITRSIARIHYGLQENLLLGNLDAKRDWGYARDYVEAMWLMLQQDESDNYVICTGECHSVREFVEQAFKEIAIDIQWDGTGSQEKGFDPATGKILVCVDPEMFRPTEVEYYRGDPKKARNKLNWEPTTNFTSLVSLMVKADLQKIKKELENEHD